MNEEDPVFVVRVRGTVEDVKKALGQAAEVAKANDAFIALVRTDAVYDEAHAESAYRHAAQAINDGTAGARDVHGEFFRLIVGERQAGKGLERAGVAEGQEGLVIVAAGAKAGAAAWGLLDRLGWSKDPTGLGTNDAALETLGIDPVPDKPDKRSMAVLEHVALAVLEGK